MVDLTYLISFHIFFYQGRYVMVDFTHRSQGRYIQIYLKINRQIYKYIDIKVDYTDREKIEKKQIDRNKDRPNRYKDR